MADHSAPTTDNPVSAAASYLKPFFRQFTWAGILLAALIGVYYFLFMATGTLAPGVTSWAGHAFIVVGTIVVVAVGANWLVDSAVRISNSLGISKAVIGLTVVAFGTSAPELAVSVSAGLQEHGSVAIGNIVGSNIFNLGFILGGVALISPIIVARQTVKRDGLFLLGTTIALFFFLWDLQLQWYEGVIMFTVLALYMGILFFRKIGQEHAVTATVGADGTAQATAIAAGGDASHAAKIGADGEVIEPPEEAEEEEISDDKATWWDAFIFMMGLAAVVAGCHMLVDSSIWIAGTLGVPEWAIAVTIVAAGTSAPEAAVSLVAAVKGQHEISAGNLIGSDLFNILGVLGVAAVLNAGIGTPLSIQEPEPESRIGAVVFPQPLSDIEEGTAGTDSVTAPDGTVLEVLYVDDESAAHEVIDNNDQILGIGSERFSGEAATDPNVARQQFREALTAARSGQTIDLLILDGANPAAEPSVVAVPVGAAQMIRLRKLDINEAQKETLIAERAQALEDSQEGFTLVHAQTSLIALIGMVLITIIFMRTGWRVGRVEGGILVLIALSRWGFDLFG